MKKLTKYILIFLCLLCTAMLFACNNCNNVEKYTEGLDYTLINDDKAYEVSGLGSAWERDIIIPASYKGLPVISIGKVAFVSSRLTSVMIPSSVETIGNNAFLSCINLTNVTFADGSVLKTIGDSAFLNCPDLIKIVIPNIVTNIDDYAFAYCYRLTSIEIPNSVTNIGNYAFADCFSLTSITIPSSVKTIGIESFGNCPVLIVASGNTAYKMDGDCLLTIDGKILIRGFNNISSGVEIIGNHAFSERANLTNIIIPNSVTKISDYAFSHCSGSIIMIPSSVKTIGNSAFYNCSDLSDITIASGVETIGDKVFNNCIKLTSITIPDSVKTIGINPFINCSALTNVVVASGNTAYKMDGNCLLTIDDKILIKGLNNIPSGVEIIGDYAFYKCANLTSIIIPNSVTKIGNNAFYDCSGLTGITIPSSVKTIGNSAFSGCSGLTGITIPSSVKTIGDSAFSGCSGLTSITIPSSVEIIGNYVFYYCKGLTNITIPSSVKTIGKYAFSGCSSLASITIPSSVKTIGNCAFEFCIRLTIYSELKNAYTEWDFNWNISNCPVIWNCTLSADKTYVATFTKNADSIFNPKSHTISAPYSDGFAFGGWSTNPDGTGIIYTAENIMTVPNGTTLYAIWNQN